MKNIKESRMRLEDCLLDCNQIKDSSELSKIQDVFVKDNGKLEDQNYSVLMSLYKKEHPEYLQMAVESMLNQTVPPDEIVIVEDGPLTKELYQVLNMYKEKYPLLIRTHRNKENLGLGLALNEGLKVCKNEFVARMDTDDISKPDRCEKQLKRFAEKSELAIVGCYIDEFRNSTDNIISRRTVPCNSKDIYEYAKRRSAFNHPTVMYRKSIVLSYGGYADLKRNQDVDLFGRMLYGGCKAENIDESLLWFRTSDELSMRRKSLENTSSYIMTIRRFWKMGYSSFMDFLSVAIAQTGLYLMPVNMQNYIYRKFLRK